MAIAITLSMEEIARRLFKHGWADTKEYNQALSAVSILTSNEWKQLKAIVIKSYGIDIDENF